MGISCSRDHSLAPYSKFMPHRSKVTGSSSSSPPCFRLRRAGDDLSQWETPSPAERRRRLSPPNGASPSKPSDLYLPSPVVRDYAAVSTQNSQFRKHMEDECVAIPTYKAFPDDPAVSSFFGVYDGHGGDFCAKYAAKYFHQKLAERMQVKYSAKQRTSDESSNRSYVTSTSSMDNCSDVEADVLSNADIESCYADAFSSLDKELEDFDESSESGSTAVTCLIRKYNGRTTFHIANVGDSRAIFCCDGQTSRLSVDHKATNEDEVKRIRALNGIIVNKRVAGSISVTRAFGQADEKKFITSAPHIASLEIASDNAFLVLVSDGVTDVFSDEELTGFVAKRLAAGEKSITIAKMLLEEAKAQGAMDNMTAVIIRFGD
ncbi:Protein phosphatase 2C [Phytophthora megakarya]|uniref:protein-serine/threonine phosphatase n=1 Tax=Phytophthora megakarya TaxID=4795 RepID=A0A225VIW5_9STRA|nr:Protein phosphatase 2C [Phytophthora megakarya]